MSRLMKLLWNLLECDWAVLESIAFLKRTFYLLSTMYSIHLRCCSNRWKVGYLPSL